MVTWTENHKYESAIYGYTQPVFFINRMQLNDR